jgi:hypothetical protein
VLYEGEKEVARLEKLNGGWGVFFCGKSGIPLKEQEKERLAGGMEYDEAVGMLFKTIMEKRVIDRLVKSWFDGGKAACGVELSGIDALINRLGR